MIRPAADSPVSTGQPRCMTIPCADLRLPRWLGPGLPGLTDAETWVPGLPGTTAIALDRRTHPGRRGPQVRRGILAPSRRSGHARRDRH